MDRMASMTAFTKVVGAGSFSAAAREMQVSQALVTKQIQELESWLGARLLNRTTRRLSLTEIGTGFYERAARILEAVEEARNAAGALQTAPRGRLPNEALSMPDCAADCIARACVSIAFIWRSICAEIWFISAKACDGPKDWANDAAKGSAGSITTTGFASPV